ncbi:hypothetical protein [Vibrio coralliilyticus]|uniref:hypothetical protein n=1 Tax=Vibrio coralliilyticus TaxID=190893 RepID=UPI001E58FD03|nr:hypothetical protein [Vibrio coralliilyticus]MCC2525558.1 hypothetical protein [Vibrio coralliilyticus]
MNGILDDPICFVKSKEYKRALCNVVEAQDQSCWRYKCADTTGLLIAIAEVELELLVLKGIKGIGADDCRKCPDESKHLLYEMGRVIGSKHVTLPEDSKYLPEIEGIKESGNYHFMLGYKHGVLWQSQKPEIALNPGEILKITRDLLLDSKAVFYSSIQRSNRSYLFPQDLTSATTAMLLSKIEEHLPEALNSCDGTQFNSQIGHDFGCDVIEQVRDELICRGYEFSQKEISQLDFIKWPLNLDSAISKAIRQLRSKLLKEWGHTLNGLVYGEREPQDVEGQRLLDTFCACITQTTNNEELNPEDIAIRISRHSNTMPQATKQELLSIAMDIEQASVADSFSFNITDFKHGRNIQRHDEREFDKDVFWEISCVPTSAVSLWKALLKLQQQCKTSIEVSQRYARQQIFSIEINQVGENNFTYNYSHSYPFKSENKVGISLYRDPYILV